MAVCVAMCMYDMYGVKDYKLKRPVCTAVEPVLPALSALPCSTLPACLSCNMIVDAVPTSSQAW